jgi:phosphatidylserine/phosphatidylglycerophosphate/cardiolipin synthase-like enzyme
VALAWLAAALWAAPEPVAARVTAYFDGDCETAVLRAVREAQREVLVAAFLLTRDDIVDSLVTAAKGGRFVAVKYDPEQARLDAMGNALRRLRKAGVHCTAIRLQIKGASMHHKFVVTDAAVVLTGSFNFTTSASTVNRENLVRIESPEIARQFRAAFQALGP